MNRNVVRIQTEMFKPGEVVRGERIDLYIKPPANCVWYPKMPNVSLLDDPDGGHMVGHPLKKLRFDEGGLFFRFDALGPETDGIHKGDIDYLMSSVPARKLFGEDIPHLATLAQMDVRLFKDKPYWATLALYDVDVENKRVVFNATLDLDEIYEEDEIEERR